MKLSWVYMATAAAWVVSAWRWSDWRHWRKYKSTMLYLILCDLLYNVLTYRYALWVYEPQNTPANLLMEFLIYPFVVLIYFTWFPNHGYFKQGLYVLAWGVFFNVWEAAYKYILGLYSYHHGWNVWHSLSFNILMFTMIRLHLKRPLLTYGLSAMITVVLLIAFQVPLPK